MSEVCRQLQRAAAAFLASMRALCTLLANCSNTAGAPVAAMAELPAACHSVNCARSAPSSFRSLSGTCNAALMRVVFACVAAAADGQVWLCHVRWSVEVQAGVVSNPAGQRESQGVKQRVA